MFGKMYYQTEKDFRGNHYWRGEDARPYVCDDYLFVADGLGGSGGFPHDEMNPSFFEHNYRKALLFYPCHREDQIEQADDEILDSYLSENFVELEAIRAIPSVPRIMKKHSGYFASRIVSCILLNLLRHEDSLVPSSLFSGLSALTDELSIQKRINEYADRLRQRILDQLTRVADGANLNKKNGDVKDLLLPTTLSLALFHANENGSVDVICLWAGDSRICALFPDGAVQLTKDDEKNEAITNLISLSFPFTINAKYYRFQSPFVLFAVTDGCFDWAPSYLSFEYYILLKPFQAADMNAALDEWHRFFDGLSTKDDSSTIAFNAFGLSSFQEIQEFTRKRLTDIKDKYIAQLPNLFDVVYERRIREKKSASAQALKALRDTILNDPAVVNYAITTELDHPSEHYIESIRENEATAEKLKANRNKIEDAIRVFIQDNWHLLRPMSKPAAKSSMRLPWEPASPDDIYLTLLQIETTMNNSATEYNAHIGDLLSQASSLSDEIRDILTQMAEPVKTGGCIVPSDYLRVRLFEIIEQYKKDLLPNLQDSAVGKLNAQREYISAADRTAKLRKKLLESETEEVDKLIKTLFSNRLPEYSTSWPQWCGEWIASKQEELLKLQHAMNTCTSEKRSILEECAKRSASEHFQDILQHFAERSYQELSAEVQGKINACISETQKELEELDEKNRIQASIFHDTDLAHLRFISEE